METASLQRVDAFAHAREAIPLPKRKILVVEDHPFFREQLVEFLNKQPKLVCSGQASRAEEVFPAVESLNPDLVLLDMRLGDFNSLRLLPELRRAFPWLYIIVLTQYDTNRFSTLAIEAGADAFLMKTEAASNLYSQINSLLSSSKRQR
jgi:two-component system, NarL family, response regulator